MSKAETITVTVKADTSQFVHAIRELTYEVETAHAAFTRLGRAMWPFLPFWKRWWLTLRRKGW